MVSSVICISNRWYSTSVSGKEVFHRRGAETQRKYNCEGASVRRINLA
jgi:hypothetical protein